MVGMQVTRGSLDQRMGGIALGLRQNFDNAVIINDWLLANPPVDGNDPLTNVDTFNYSASEAALIRSAFADLAYMKANAFDSSQFVKRLWGIG